PSPSQRPAKKRRASSGDGDWSLAPMHDPSGNPTSLWLLVLDAMRLSKLLAALRAFRAGAPLGDVAVLKLDALSETPPGLEARLAPLRGYAPPVELPALRALPPGTLGREYAGFLDANGIAPLAISPELREHYRDQPYLLRYATTHDLHHVLSGFDTGLAGEAGAYAFTVGQGSAAGGRGLLGWARVAYALPSPPQARRVWHNTRVGLALGAAAKLVIAEPLEASFAEPLAEVRERLGIRDPARAGVLPSGRS